jgi:two-component system OmpR family sensor kinase
VAQAISAGNRSRRLPTWARRSGTEAAQLGRAFNLMLDELQADEDRLRRFVSDASHELRTPVSAIRGLVELWSQGDLRNGQPLEDAMRRIGREGTRMAGLVEDLLLLARLDENPSLQDVPVDLASLIVDSTRDASSKRPSRHIGVEAKGPVVIQGDLDALRQVIDNLVENALVHTPTDASVTVRAAEGRGLAVIEVADTGPGMRPPDAAHAFDRFWRADSSRARAGAGLGLPIVAAIVAAHGGEVAMDTSPERGTVVRVALPVAEARRKPAGPLQVPLRLRPDNGTHGDHRAEEPVDSHQPAPDRTADP